MKDTKDIKKNEAKAENDHKTSKTRLAVTKNQHKKNDPGGADLGPDLPFIGGY